MNWKVFIIVFTTIVVSFIYGRWTAKQDYKNQVEEINQLETSLNLCQSMWKLDKELFYPELCKTVCIEEFEKMSC